LSNHFQNRLVGIIVLAALGVIFLPDILDGKKVQPEEQLAEIPLRPKISMSSLPVEVIAPVDLSEKAQAFAQAQDTEPSQDWVIVDSGDQQAVQNKSTTITAPAKPNDKRAKINLSSAVAFTLQLGSFNNAANVKALVNRLRVKGFSAYTLPRIPVDGKLTKVFVGPELSKFKLKSLQLDIEKLTKLKGRIVSYDPIAS